MNKQELLFKLRQLSASKDTEAAHSDADKFLLLFIDDQEIADAYNAIDKWYA